MTGTADLPAALRAHARGLHCREAAVELLISHASWLRRDDFLHQVVHTAPGLIDGTPMTPIDWTEAVAALDRGQLPCSGGEGRMLRLAASLVEGIPVDLRDAVTGLDGHNADLVSQAVKHASGHR
jgi:hypothetical protein